MHACTVFGTGLTVINILQMRKLSLQDVKELAQLHIVSGSVVTWTPNLTEKRREGWGGLLRGCNGVDWVWS